MTPPVSLREFSCAKVRRRLDSYLTGELSVDLSHEILEHLDRCPDCTHECAAREGLRASFRRVAARAEEPRPEFEAEVRALLARTPAPRALPVPVLLAAAALVAAAGIAGWFALSPAGRAPTLAAGTALPRDPAAAGELDSSAADFVARDHRNCARAAEWPREADSAEAFTRGVAEPFASAARNASARLAGFAPVSAHECDHAGETVFHVILRRRGEAGRDGLVSLVVTRPGSALAAGASVGPRVDSASRLGFSVAGARAGDGRLVLVATSGDQNAAREIGRAILPAFAPVVASR